MISDNEMLSLLALAVLGIVLVSKSGGGSSTMNNGTSRLTELFQKHKVVIVVMGVVIMVYFMYQWGMLGDSSSCASSKVVVPESEGFLDIQPRIPDDLPSYATLPSQANEVARNNIYRGRAEGFTNDTTASPEEPNATVEGNFLTAPSHTKMFEQIVTDPTHAYMMSVSQSDPTRDINLCPLTRKFLTQDLRHQIPVPIEEEKVPFMMSSQASKSIPPTCINRGIDSQCYTRM